MPAKTTETARVPEDLSGRQRRMPVGGITWRHTFRALRHPNYRLFFWGQLVSLTGTWMQLLHPRASERDELAPEEQPIIGVAQRAKCVPPRYATHGHAPLSAAEVFRHACSFRSFRGHQ